MKDRLKLYQGSITDLEVDAIVNAANNSLLGGGGVDGAIHQAAGPELLEECRKLDGCDTGSAKITNGYKLKAKYVIHTVGPIWTDGHNSEAELLENCYHTCFKIAEDHEISSIAFPAISTGVYRFPMEPATRIALKVTKTVLESNKNLEKVTFCCFNQKSYEIYSKLIAEL